jgi:putative ABC transport system substrate-binding protein
VQSQTEKYRAKAKEFARLTRPGGNITGNTILGLDVSGKRLELIKEVIPSVSRVAFLGNPNRTIPRTLASSQSAPMR